MADASFNHDKYAELLVWARPGIIEDPEEHDRLLSIAEQLMDKGENLSPEERKLLALIVFLVEAFEAEVEESEDEGDDDESGIHQPAEPHETLRRLLEGRGLDLADISDVFGNPQNAHEAIEGQRPITRGQAKQLARFFGVPAKIFLA